MTKNCLVFGNGKSIKDFDFRSIDRDKYSWIGCCLAFRHWDTIDCYPDIYVNVDKVVCKNEEVIDFIKQKKCQLYLLSKSILEKVDLSHRQDIYYIEELVMDCRSVFKYSRNYCSGSSAVLMALDLFETIEIAGFDCDYVEFIPECEQLEDGTLRITKTPENNPNYFFDDYQREGDIYNVPNGTRVHLRSWNELSEILKFLIFMYPECQRTITNYNDKKSISEYFKTKSQKYLMGQSLTRVNNDPKQTIAFCVPTTSKNMNWTTLEETHLYTILLPSIYNLTSDFNIELYLGYDHDDQLYSTIDLPKSYQNIKMNWVSFEGCKGNPCKIWTDLSKRAIDDGIEYLQIGGDDIMYDGRKEWLGKFIKLLKKNNNVGYSAGYSNNDRIPTQFLLHKKHFECFGFIYPPQIHNWFCDDYIFGLYKGKGNWCKEYFHQNMGGEPRYQPKNDKKLCEMLIKRHKKLLNNLN